MPFLKVLFLISVSGNGDEEPQRQKGRFEEDYPPDEDHPPLSHHYPHPHHQNTATGPLVVDSSSLAAGSSSALARCEGNRAAASGFEEGSEMRNTSSELGDQYDKAGPIFLKYKPASCSLPLADSETVRAMSKMNVTSTTGTGLEATTSLLSAEGAPDRTLSASDSVSSSVKDKRSLPVSCGEPILGTGAVSVSASSSSTSGEASLLSSSSHHFPYRQPQLHKPAYILKPSPAVDKDDSPTITLKQEQSANSLAVSSLASATTPLQRHFDTQPNPDMAKTRETDQHQQASSTHVIPTRDAFSTATDKIGTRAPAPPDPAASVYKRAFEETAGAVIVNSNPSDLKGMALVQEQRQNSMLHGNAFGPFTAHAPMETSAPPLERLDDVELLQKLLIGQKKQQQLYWDWLRTTGVAAAAAAAANAARQQLTCAKLPTTSEASGMQITA